MDIVAKSAYNNNRAYEGCTRCVLDALQQNLHLIDDYNGYKAALKASTGLAAGVARQGETCGALIGAIMGVGLAIGTERLDDLEDYVKTMEAAKRVFENFKKHFGTVKCVEIQEKVLGRRYDFFNEEDREAWYQDGGLDACPGVCAIAARTAAEVILGFKAEK